MDAASPLEPRLQSCSVVAVLAHQFLASVSGDWIDICLWDPMGQYPTNDSSNCRDVHLPIFGLVGFDPARHMLTARIPAMDFLPEMRWRSKFTSAIAQLPGMAPWLLPSRLAAGHNLSTTQQAVAFRGQFQQICRGILQVLELPWQAVAAAPAVHPKP